LLNTPRAIPSKKIFRAREEEITIHITVHPILPIPYMKAVLIYSLYSK
jgi:hypothetical protein